jgi:tetratricopeptide (TPR) repeat protein
VSVSATQRRLQNFQFPPAVAHAPPSEHPAKRSTIEQWLEQGNDAIAAGDVSGATIAFGRVLQQAPGSMPATYGLAVAALLKGDAEAARQLFEQVTASAANPPVCGGGASKGSTQDPSIVAWAHVYLGRIHDIEGEREQAVGEYRAALAIGRIPEAAKTAAEQGLQSAYHAPSRGAGPPKQ